MEILGNGVSFDDVEKLRKQLVAQQMNIFDRQEKITVLMDELRTGKQEDQRQLELHRIQLINDKEQQKEAGMTKKDWETYIKKELTLQDELNINEKYADYETKIGEHERRIQLSKIHRDNLRWKLINRLTYARAIFGGVLADEEIKIEGK